MTESSYKNDGQADVIGVGSEPIRRSNPDAIIHLKYLKSRLPVIWAEKRRDEERECEGVIWSSQLEDSIEAFIAAQEAALAEPRNDSYVS